MLLIPSKQQEKMQTLMQQIVYGFNSWKLDAIQQIKNVTAVVVKNHAPNTPPSQTWWIWVDTVWWYSYISTGTTNVTDWSKLWSLWWAIWNKQIAVWNISWKIVWYAWFEYDTVLQKLSVPAIDVVWEVVASHFISNQSKTYAYNGDWTINTITFTDGRVITYHYDTGVIDYWSDTVRKRTVTRVAGVITAITVTVL